MVDHDGNTSPEKFWRSFYGPVYIFTSFWDLCLLRTYICCLVHLHWSSATSFLTQIYILHECFFWTFWNLQQIEFFWYLSFSYGSVQYLSDHTCSRKICKLVFKRLQETKHVWRKIFWKDGRTEVKQYTPSPFGERGYNKGEKLIWPITASPRW